MNKWWDESPHLPNVNKKEVPKWWGESPHIPNENKKEMLKKESHCVPIKETIAKKRG
jgi:hypothetical protein